MKNRKSLKNGHSTAEDVLSRYDGTRKRVRIFHGDSDTGRDSMEEWRVTGIISHSTGPSRVFLLMPTRRSLGGIQVTPSAVVRMIVDGNEVYRHPSYHLPKMTIDGTTVYVNGKAHARFKTVAAMNRWIAFMEGRRMAK